MRKILLFFVSAYKVLFSPWMGGACRFYPSCSEYALQVLRRHSWWKGFFYSFWRILKCHPLHPGGLDWPK